MDKFLNQKLFESKKVLVQPGIYKELNVSKITISKGELSKVDYIASVVKLNQLKIQYEAMAYTLVKINELSLIKFLR